MGKKGWTTSSICAHACLGDIPRTIGRTHLEDELLLLVTLRIDMGLVLCRWCNQTLDRQTSDMRLCKRHHNTLTYFQPRMWLQFAHRTSLTVCRPVVICRSSASPRVMLTTWSNRHALPVWPLKF